MTRKDYRVIAAALSEAKPPQTNEAPNPDNYGELLLVWTRTVKAIARNLRMDNANFNAAKFFDYCDCAY